MQKEQDQHRQGKDAKAQGQGIQIGIPPGQRRGYRNRRVIFGMKVGPRRRRPRRGVGPLTRVGIL